MASIRVAPDRVAAQAARYDGVVRRVERAADELLADLARCSPALGREVAGPLSELRASVAHGLDVLASDHRQVAAGLAAVAACFRELDEGLFR